METSEILQILQTIYNTPISEIAKLHPDEIAHDLAELEDNTPGVLLSFTADEANAAICEAEGDPRWDYTN